MAIAKSLRFASSHVLPHGTFPSRILLPAAKSPHTHPSFPISNPVRFGRVVQSWDTANKASELNDFRVCTSWGIDGRDVYLLDALRRRIEYPELKRTVVAEYARLRPDVVLIEDRASGTQLIQELRDEGMHAATSYRPQADKVMRIYAQTAMIENGFVHLPQQAAWLGEYLHELAVFPGGRHDDQVDATAQFLEWFKAAGREDGVYALYRMRYEEKRRREGAPPS
jgi:predicted phage terminase large subunit-like protein